MLAHTQAVRAKIQEVPALASKTYTGRAPRDAQGKLPAAPFVVIHPADGIDGADRLTGPRSVQNPRFTLHVVGSSSDNVQTITAAVKAKFVVNGFGVAPDVPGEVTSRLTWSSPIPIQWDLDVNPPIPYQVIELSFTSEPA